MEKNIAIVEFYKISGDQFYELITNQKDAFFKLYKALPIAIEDYLSSLQETAINLTKDSALDEIKTEIGKSNRTIIDQISFENFSYYLDFDKL